MTATQQPSTKQDILHYLAKQGQVSAQALAEHFGISPQAIRRHLKDLTDEGLVEHEAMQVGMGRPNYLYRLSREGRDRLPERYDEFAVSLLTTLAETVGPDQMGSILRKQWEQKALEYRKQVGSGTLQERVMRLVDLRKAEGLYGPSGILWNLKARRQNRSSLLRNITALFRILPSHFLVSVGTNWKCLRWRWGIVECSGPTG
ncbi:iron-sulfur cluster biosynthesis transcriptional regulator SufR [Leptolyngbya sp. O-77]|uniref:iron-sulfur cluster biosynthesis transcriptional regulator SufR n=1 Tax=Leptolyngbya sp. O-77 TaxID=1080068 RepID=UPI00074D344A|nr:iron-sulfur cluster biosynthesis transcriptional regulator SufR [Leptolyngbya sp. O-77]BAU44124.1 DNA-binding transcriptional repressor GlpR [Leptolyngbya sp. O-77]